MHREFFCSLAFGFGIVVVALAYGFGGWVQDLGFRCVRFSALLLGLEVRVSD